MKVKALALGLLLTFCSIAYADPNVVTLPDGSTQTTLNNPDGTVVILTQHPDGTSDYVVQKPDGTALDYNDNTSSN